MKPMSRTAGIIVALLLTIPATLWAMIGLAISFKDSMGQPINSGFVNHVRVYGLSLLPLLVSGAILVRWRANPGLLSWMSLLPIAAGFWIGTAMLRSREGYASTLEVVGPLLAIGAFSVWWDRRSRTSRADGSNRLS